MFYSPSTGGFYSSEINGDDMPDDVIDISAETYAAVLAAQEAGKRIVPGADGSPVAADPLPPTAEQLLQINTATRDRKMAVATARIAPLQDAVDLGIATPEEVAQLTAWKRYRVDLSRLDLSLEEVDWPMQPD